MLPLLAKPVRIVVEEEPSTHLVGTDFVLEQEPTKDESDELICEHTALRRPKDDVAGDTVCVVHHACREIGDFCVCESTIQIVQSSLDQHIQQAQRSFRRNDDAPAFVAVLLVPNDSNTQVPKLPRR